MRDWDIKTSLLSNSTNSFKTFLLRLIISMMIFENNPFTYNLRLFQMKNVITMYKNAFLQTLPKCIPIFRNW